LIFLALLIGCGGEPAAPKQADDWTSQELRTLGSLRWTDQLPKDATNRLDGHEGAVSWGRELFYDPGLSPAAVSCATCHDPELHFTDGKELGEGVGTTARHTPTVEGTQLGPWFFWDGRADSLWHQATGPIEHPDEMASNRVYVARYAATRWPERVAELSGVTHDRDLLPDGGTPARPLGDPLRTAWDELATEQQAQVDKVFITVAKAIAAFEMQVIPHEAAFDSYVDAVLAGDSTGGGHLNESQIRGLSFFLREGNCASCHLGPFFTDGAFHNLGLPVEGIGDIGRTKGAQEVLASELNCRGRFSDTELCEELRFLNPTFDDFRAAFKTPTLRNVTETAPYMHDGKMATLDDVLDFYSELPGEPFTGHRELTLVPLDFSEQERADLKAFLASLTAPVPDHIKAPQP